MQHPFTILKPEYTSLLAAMVVRPDREHLVDQVATRLLTHKTRYQDVTDRNGVPVIFIATSFEREASSDFTKNPAQGWPLAGHSRWVPHNGPFRTWLDAAVTAYHLNGLDRVGAGNWTWELICFYGELFNGMGYRDFHRMHSPYLWGGTNIQTVGKYTSDGEFDAGHMDGQLGIIPVARRMAQLDPSLALPAAVYVPAPPVASGLSVAAEHPEADAKWVQATLGSLGYSVHVDGSYGRETMRAVADFQRDYALEVDGLAGPKTISGLKEALANVVIA
jgi:lysozyme family protein